MNYELTFIISPVVPETEHDKIQSEILGYIEKAGAKISREIQAIGRRKLAYPIKKQKHGFYAFLEFEAEDKSGFKEMETKLKHNPSILRHLLIKKDKKAVSVLPEIQAEKPSGRTNESAKTSSKKEDVKTTPKEDIKLDLGDINKKLDEILDSDPKLD